MRRTLGAYAALACLLGGCGAADLAVTDAPGPDVDSPVPRVSEPAAAFPAPPECPPMRDLRDGEDVEDVNPGVGRASQTILAKRGMPAHAEIRRYSTGHRSCAAGNFLIIFRVPGGTVFEGWVRRVAAKHGVTLHFVDTRYPLSVLERTGDEVKARMDDLAQAGASLRHTWPETEGGACLKVHVEGDLDAARAVLADFGDKVNVVDRFPTYGPCV
jgi:hypothetical protein